MLAYLFNSLLIGVEHVLMCGRSQGRVMAVTKKNLMKLRRTHVLYTLNLCLFILYSSLFYALVCGECLFVFYKFIYFDLSLSNNPLSSRNFNQQDGHFTLFRITTCHNPRCDALSPSCCLAKTLEFRSRYIEGADLFKTGAASRKYSLVLLPMIYFHPAIY